MYVKFIFVYVLKIDIELFITILCPEYVLMVDIEYLKRNPMSTFGHSSNYLAFSILALSGHGIL